MLVVTEKLPNLRHPSPNHPPWDFVLFHQLDKVTIDWILFFSCLAEPLQSWRRVTILSPRVQSPEYNSLVTSQQYERKDSTATLNSFNTPLWKVAIIFIRMDVEQVEEGDLKSVSCPKTRCSAKEKRGSTASLNKKTTISTFDRISGWFFLICSHRERA